MNRSCFALVFALLIFVFRGPAVFGDVKADTLMRQVAATTRQTHSLSGILTLRDQSDGGKIEVCAGKVYLQKPNLAHLENSLSFGSSFGTVNSDGKRIWERMGRNVYRPTRADATGQDIQFYYALPVAYFFNPTTPLTTMFAVDKVSALHFLGKKTLNGVSYDVVEQAVLEPDPYTVRLYIGADKLLRRAETNIPASEGDPHQHYFEADFSQMIVNKLIPAERFAYVLPPDAVIYVPPKSRLLAVGSQAPDFSLKTMSGGTLTLQDALRGKKAIYLDFWFCECMACRQEFPDLQKLYAALEAQGLVIYGVNALDNAQKVRRFMSQLDLLKSAKFPILLTGSGDPTGMLKRYGIVGYPTGYLIDATGKIIFTSSGYGFDDKSRIKDLTTALMKAGLRP